MSKPARAEVLHGQFQYRCWLGHDLEPAFRIEDVYAETRDATLAVGLKPLSLEYSDPQHKNRRKRLHLLPDDFDVGRETLGSFAITSVRDKSTQWWDSALSVSMRDHRSMRLPTQTRVCIAAATSLDPAMHAALEDLFEKLIRRARPSYGYSLTLPRGVHPVTFGSGSFRAYDLDGVTYGGAPTKVMERRISRWSQDHRIHLTFRDRKLRGVFRVNYLNAAHLRIPITGAPLGDAIATMGWGVLEQFSPTLWRWTLDEDMAATLDETFGDLGVLI